MQYEQKALPAGVSQVTARERLFLASLVNDSASILQVPARLELSAWTGHIPFAFWLMDVVRPKTLVELGTHTGVSFCAFCQQADNSRISGQFYAVDTWQGDEHAGYYGENIYNDIAPYIEKNYGSFAHALRMTFDDASKLFAPGSIDVLHIDGYHTKEAIMHDFETWVDKLGDRGVALFHDINVHLPGYGGVEAWRDISYRYPHFSFYHSSGLGVALVGKIQPKRLNELANLGSAAADLVRKHFENAGRLPVAMMNQHLANLKMQKDVEAVRIQEDATRHAMHESHVREIENIKNEFANEAGNLAQQLNATREQITMQQTHIAALEELIQGYENSKSWKLTAPLRKARKILLPEKTNS